MPVSPKDEEEAEETTEVLETVVTVQMALTEKENHVEDGRVFSLKTPFNGQWYKFNAKNDKIPPNYRLSSISLH